MRPALVLALIGIGFLPASALAQQQRPKLQVANVRVGFPAGYAEDVGERIYFYKAGSWTPVHVDIQVGRDGLRGNEGLLKVVVETPDCDEVLTNYSVDVPLEKLDPNAQFTVSTLTKMGATAGDVTVTLYYDGTPLTQPYKKTPTGTLDGNQALYVTLGSRMVNLRVALRPEAGDNVNVNQPQRFDGRENIAYIDSVAQMPQHWFGYEGVDLLILSTSNREFLKRLDASDKRYREALAEWVLRGGHLVIAVGQNQDAFAAFAEWQPLLPVSLPKTEAVTGMRMSWSDGAGERVLGPLPGGQPQTVATIEGKPGRSFRSLMKRDVAGQDLIVQGAAGLGCVTVVAFDLDQRPFIDWKHVGDKPLVEGQPTPNPQADFFKQLITRSWARSSAIRGQDDGMNNNMGFGYNADNQLLTQLYGYLENFEEVPVISFAWVALFIFLYILVVGPLDYFFLKKVVKRLELTWITFPTVVLTISAIAYFTAYYIKGKDLRIRKVDLVDVDMTASQPVMSGQTWFTLFSPRIQHYTIGVEPAPGTWVPEANEAGSVRGPDVVVSWLGRPETDRFGGRSSRGQSLFRRAYDYDPAASALRGVPIQVWSTKSFTASWQSAANAKQPLVSAKLKHLANDERFLVGDITWLPGSDAKTDLELSDAYLLYNDQATKVVLESGKAATVDTRKESRQQPMSLWLGGPGQNPNNNFNRFGNRPPATNLDYPMRATLFFDELFRGKGFEHNAGLRSLDQSWRLPKKDKRESHAILVGRLPSRQGAAEDLSKHAASATRLWLGAVPTPGAARPPLEGVLRQDTYVRIFLPVQD
jgi:hypothetical protein